jgi:hypothetical protein
MVLNLILVLIIVYCLLSDYSCFFCPCIPLSNLGALLRSLLSLDSVYRSLEAYIRHTLSSRQSIS